jgi:hypothetical protein
MVGFIGIVRQFSGQPQLVADEHRTVGNRKENTGWLGDRTCWMCDSQTTLSSNGRKAVWNHGRGVLADDPALLTDCGPRVLCPNVDRGEV